jgi:hypothetical protein
MSGGHLVESDEDRIDRKVRAVRGAARTSARRSAQPCRVEFRVGGQAASDAWVKGRNILRFPSAIAAIASAISWRSASVSWL